LQVSQAPARGSEPTEEAGQHSNIDKNVEISVVEKRDFDDVECRDRLEDCLCVPGGTKGLMVCLIVHDFNSLMRCISTVDWHKLCTLLFERDIWT
jgi:hypothetical protein